MWRPPASGKGARSDGHWLVLGGAAGLALLVAVILGGLFLLRGDDEAVDAAVVADIQGILDSLPDLEGKTDMEQIRQAELRTPSRFFARKTPTASCAGARTGTT